MKGKKMELKIFYIGFGGHSVNEITAEEALQKARERGAGDAYIIGSEDR